MLASARTTGSSPGDPSLPAQTLGSTSARGAEGAFHAQTHPAYLLSQACRQVWVQGCGPGWATWGFSGLCLPCSDLTLIPFLYLDLFSVLS